MVFHFPPISGGGVVVITGIANTLAELGHDVTILAPEIIWNGKEYHPKLNDAIKIVKVDVPSKSNIKIAARRCYPTMKNTAINMCQNEKFDLILTIFHPFHLVPKAATEVGKKLGIPVIIKIDDAFYEKSSGLKSIQRKIEKYYNSRTLKNASRILTVNENTKQEVSKFYGVNLEKISIVPNGIETEKFFSENKNSKTIIFSGVMYYHRGLDVLLNSFPLVTKKIPDVNLILLGEGPELANLKKIVSKKNLEKNVNFLGWVDREEIIKYLSTSSIGIGPLRRTKVTENALPIKILEYMASELPLIAHKQTLPSDVLIDKKNGFVISNEKELAEKIIFLLENEELRSKMGKESKLMVQKFDLKQVVKKIIESQN